MKFSGPPDGKYIRRCYAFTEARVSGGNTVEGHAAVYGQTTNIGGWFYEVISPGAFTRADISDVAFFLNHNTNALPMARARKSIPNSSMRITPDDRGLFMSTALDIENNVDSRALVSAIDRQDVTGMSYAFLVQDETWEGLDTDMPTRTIETIAKVFEVSAVTYPAYEGTDISARSESLESDRAALERAREYIAKGEIEKQKLIAQIRSKL